MTARPLFAWPRATRAAVESMLAVPWRRWCADFGLEAGAVTCGDAATIASTWRSATQTPLQPGVSVLLLGPAADRPDAAADLARRWFGTEGASPLGLRTARGAIDALAAALGGAVPAAAPDVVCEPAASPWRRWSGALLCRFDFAPVSAPAIALLLDAAAVRRCARIDPDRTGPAGDTGEAGDAGAARPRRGLAPVWSAIGAEPLRLEVHLEGLEIPLGDFQSLCAGDVLLLPQRVDDLLDVRLATSAAAAATGDGETPLCRAVLGRRGPRRAVALLA